MKQKSWILAVLWGVLWLCACGEVAETTALPPPSPSPVAREASTIELSIVKDRVYLGDHFFDYLDALESEIDALLYEQGVPSKLRFARSRTFRALETTVPIFFTAQAGEMLQTYAKEGLVADITDELRATCPDLLALIPERAWKEVTVDGRLYCVPLLRDAFGVEDIRFGFDVWPEALDALDIAMPETSEELLRLLRAAREKGQIRSKLLIDPAVPPYPLHRTYPEWPFFVDEQMRYVLYDDGTIESYLGSEVFRRDVAFLTTLAQENLLLRIDDVDTENYQDVFVSFFPHRASNLAAFLGTGANNMRLVPYAPSTGFLAPSAPYARFGPWAQTALYISPENENVTAALSLIEAIYTNPEIARALTTPLEGDTISVHGEDVRNWARMVANDGKPIPGSVSVEASWFHEQFRSSPLESPPPSIAVADFPGGGFTLDETIIGQPHWWLRVGRSQVARFLAGRISAEVLDEEIRVTRNRLEENGYRALLDACQEQYTEYIARFP